MLKTLIAALVLFGLIQLVPYGHDHSNPAAVAQPAWASPQAAALYQRACFNCHSNLTVWPWYSHVAPVSWLVRYDVNGGRRHLNFTAWNEPQRHAKDIADEVGSGDMPPWWYLPMHPEARLSATEKKALIAAAPATQK